MSEDAEEVKNAMSLALAKAIDRVVVKAEQTPFDQLVESFRALEADYEPRFRLMGDEFLALEVRRRIAERILISAIDKEEPFEVCRTLWVDLVALGFTYLGKVCLMSWYYANLCCLPNRQIEEGIRVLEPVLLELSRALSDPELPEDKRSFYEDDLPRLQAVLDKLRSQRQ
jgi:hypothetical protein